MLQTTKTFILSGSFCFNIKINIRLNQNICLVLTACTYIYLQHYPCINTATALTCYEFMVINCKLLKELLERLNIWAHKLSLGAREDLVFLTLLLKKLFLI